MGGNDVFIHYLVVHDLEDKITFYYIIVVCALRSLKLFVVA